MITMMNAIGMSSVFVLLWAVHVLSGVVFAIGVLFLIVWALKHLTGAELKRWGIWFVVIGIVAGLFTIGIMGHPLGGFGARGGPSMMRARMMEKVWDRMMGEDGEDDVYVSDDGTEMPVSD